VRVEEEERENEDEPIDTSGFSEWLMLQ